MFGYLTFTFGYHLVLLNSGRNFEFWHSESFISISLSCSGFCVETFCSIKLGRQILLLLESIQGEIITTASVKSL